MKLNLPIALYLMAVLTRQNSGKYVKKIKTMLRALGEKFDPPTLLLNCGQQDSSASASVSTVLQSILNDNYDENKLERRF